MRHRNALLRTSGIAIAAAGVLVLAPAVVLANQRLQIVHVPWGIFDVRVNGRVLSDRAVEVAFGLTGFAMVLFGVVLLRWPRPSPV